MYRHSYPSFISLVPSAQTAQDVAMGRKLWGALIRVRLSRTDNLSFPLCFPSSKPNRKPSAQMTSCWQRILHLASVLFSTTAHPVADLAPWLTSPRQLPPTCRSFCHTASVPCSEGCGFWPLGSSHRLVPGLVDCAWNWNVNTWPLPMPFSCPSLPRRKNLADVSPLLKKRTDLETHFRCEGSPGWTITVPTSFTVHKSLHVVLLYRAVRSLVF